jgi:hypothetical protein
MQDISKFKGFIWGTNSRLTNMSNVHTCTISGVDLISTIVLLTDGQLVKFSCDVIGRTSVGVPTVVDGVGVHGCTGVPFFRDIVLLKPVPTPVRSVTGFEADLAHRLGVA